jgi:hypothetical protein
MKKSARGRPVDTQELAFKIAIFCAAPLFAALIGLIATAQWSLNHIELDAGGWHCTRTHDEVTKSLAGHSASSAIILHKQLICDQWSRD